ncbi:MAG: TraB/GumN family protein [Thermoplasmatota archaeon]
MPTVELVDERITLVGTAHVSEKSVAEVREAIERVRPDFVAVELDENRMKALTDKKRFEDTPITDLVRGGKSVFILAQVMLASFQRRMGEKQGVEPGAEMLAAVEEAQRIEKPVVLADRDIGVTLRRAWAKMGAGEKIRLSWEFMKALVGLDPEEVDTVEVDALLEDDVLTVMMEELSQAAPSVAEVLVRERDAYLAKRIHEAAQKGSVLAVIGAGHLKGVEDYLRHPEKLPADTKALEVIPKKKVRWGLIISILFLAATLALYGWLIYRSVATGDYTQLKRAILAYIVATAGCTALGALLARAHPLAILAGALAAPTKLIHPFVGSGIFPGLVQAKYRKPTVKDLQGISKLDSWSDLLKNRATHVLIVTSFAQLGADLGFFVVFPLAVIYGVHV